MALFIYSIFTLVLFSCVVLMFKWCEFFNYHLGAASWLAILFSLDRLTTFSATTTAENTVTSDDTGLHW